MDIFGLRPQSIAALLAPSEDYRRKVSAADCREENWIQLAKAGFYCRNCDVYNEVVAAFTAEYGSILKQWAKEQNIVAVQQHQRMPILLNPGGKFSIPPGRLGVVIPLRPYKAFYRPVITEEVDIEGENPFLMKDGAQITAQNTMKILVFDIEYRVEGPRATAS